MPDIIRPDFNTRSQGVPIDDEVEAVISTMYVFNQATQEWEPAGPTIGLGTDRVFVRRASDGDNINPSTEETLNAVIDELVLAKNELIQIARGIEDANNTTSGVVLPAFAGVPYAPNVGGAPTAPTADMWVGDWTDIRDTAGAQISAAASQVGRGWAEFSVDGGATISHYYSTLFLGFGDFAIPPGARYYRLLFQNLWPAPSNFRAASIIRFQSLQPFMFPVAGLIDPTFPAVLVKASITGQQPDGDFVNVPSGGSDPGNTTTILLGANDTFTGVGYDATGWGSLVVIVNASHVSAVDGLKIEFSNDGFVTIPQVFEFSYRVADVGKGRRYIVPANLGEEYRIKYTNGAVAQTSFDLRTELAVTNVQPMTDDKGRGTLLVSPGLRISQVLGRDHKEVQGINLAADTTLFSVPVGKTLYITSIEWSIENSSSLGTGRVRLRDGGAAGTVKSSTSVREATTGLGGINETSEKVITYSEPIVFDTDIFLDIVTGTLLVDVILVGYLEDE